MSVCDHEDAQIDSRREPVRSYMRLQFDVFLNNANFMLWPKINNKLINFYIRISSLRVESTTFIPPFDCLHHYATSVFSVWQTCENFVIYKGDWLSIKYCETDSVQKLFLFFENTFQYLGGIAQDISVSHFDSCRSLSSANRRRSTSLILFVTFTHPCDQHDRKIRTIRKSAVRWHGRRALGCRKSIFRANSLYVPNIKM